MNYSRKRESILACLESAREHPTAEQIYVAVRKDFPQISPGTVYRNLAQLVEAEQISCLPDSMGRMHYDAITRPHYHFCCDRCGCILDLPPEDFPKGTPDVLNDMASRVFAGRIDGHRLVFSGLCETCLKAEAAASEDSGAAGDASR